MAAWSELLQFVKKNYKVEVVNENFLKLVFDVGSLRSQVVFLSRASLMNDTEDWLQIESPFAEPAAVDCRAALSRWATWSAADSQPSEISWSFDTPRRWPTSVSASSSGH